MSDKQNRPEENTSWFQTTAWSWIKVLRQSPLLNGISFAPKECRMNQIQRRLKVIVFCSVVLTFQHPIMSWTVHHPMLSEWCSLGCRNTALECSEKDWHNLNELLWRPQWAPHSHGSCSYSYSYWCKLGKTMACCTVVFYLVLRLWVVQHFDEDCFIGLEYSVSVKVIWNLTMSNTLQ